MSLRPQRQHETTMPVWSTAVHATTKEHHLVTFKTSQRRAALEYLTALTPLCMQTPGWRRMCPKRLSYWTKHFKAVHLYSIAAIL